MSAAANDPPRRVLLAGSTGLVGRALLTRLERDTRCSRLDLLLRRERQGDPIDAGKTHRHLVDFAALANFSPVDDAYIALGTTIKAAGSEEAFRAVDFDAVVAVARAARAAGATRLAVVSALGADRGSRVFYNRVKGDMEAAIAKLGYDSVVVAQPSLLVGDRSALGQRPRPVEVWAARLLGPVMGLVPRSVRPIAADDVATSLIAALAEARPGVRVLSSSDMQGAAARH